MTGTTTRPRGGRELFAAIVAQLRRQPARVLTMLVGVLVATSGFTVLTGAVESSQLRVSGTLDENFRAAYDLLVRPRGSRAALEHSDGLVRPNFLSGQFGGITFDEYEQITALPGVEVAAPVGMVGYTPVNTTIELDLTDDVDLSADRQLLRVRHTWLSDRGLSAFEDPGYHYVYLTRQEVLWPMYEPTEHENEVRFAGYRRGGELVDVDITTCVPDRGEAQPLREPPVEIQADGTAVPICDLGARPYGRVGLDAQDRTRFEVVHLRDDGTFERVGSTFAEADPRIEPRLTISVTWPMTLLLAVVDPVQEARLVGLDESVLQGRYLRPDDEPQPRGGDDPRTDVPVLISSTPQLDEQLSSVVEQVGEVPQVSEVSFPELRRKLGGLPGERVASFHRSADGAYEQLDADEPDVFVDFNRIVRSGQPTYQDAGGGSLRPVPTEVDLDDVWARESLAGTGGNAPVFGTDAAFRPLDGRTEVSRLRGDGGWPVAKVLGTFDPTRLTEFSSLSEVPLETYQPASAVGADPASRSLLGGEALAPNSNPGGYLATPPQLLTTFASLPELVVGGDPLRDAPISAVRIRVADVAAGLDEQSQQRLQQLAEQIVTKTGLVVDITIGSSPGPRTVDLPGGSYGRPDLRLTEGWSTKGLAVALVREIDRKSLALFGLILLACVLFLGNAVSASVRVRRRELAVLTCLGWPRGRITALVLGEVTLVGLAAGTLSLALAFPLAAVTGIQLTPTRALLAVPVAVALAATAGLIPALRATRTYPWAALHVPVLHTSRTRRHRTLLGLAAAGITRVPARSLVGIAALAVGVAAVTALTLITTHFHDQAQGTLLGDAVSVQVRGVDLAAAITTVVLGVFAIADALYLNIRERAAELAALRACGWSDAELGRMVVYEGAVLGTIGVLLGGALGLTIVGWFIGAITAPAILTTAAVAGAGAALTILAAVIPAQLMRGLPLAAVLAED